MTRAFGTTDALADLSLTLSRGEFVAFLGPSGSGKSTALNCVAGLLSLTGGSIHLDDRRIDHLPPERRGFSMVFQNYALYPHMTVRRNVAFGLQMRRVGRREIERRVTAALELVKLAHHAQKYPAQLSGGEQQRVAIARAIVTEPPLVLMDEPLSNLDAQLRLEMRTEIRRLHQELGLTTVYVTHDQGEAMSLADRIVILRGGRVQQIGTPEEVYASPSTSFVASFMGYRNIFDGSVVEHRNGHVHVEVKGVRLTGITPQGLSSSHAVVAIRPEDVHLEDHGGQNDNTLGLTVKVVEYGGREYTIVGETPDGLDLHLIADRPIDVGGRISVSMPAERVRVYDRAD